MAAAVLDILIIAVDHLRPAHGPARHHRDDPAARRRGHRLRPLPSRPRPRPERRQLPRAQLAARSRPRRHRHLPAGDPARPRARRPHQRPALADQAPSRTSPSTRSPPPSSNLARLRHGAIIVLERGTGLEDYIETGVRLDAELNAKLHRGHLLPQLAPARQGADHPRRAHRRRFRPPCPSPPRTAPPAWARATAPPSASASRRTRSPSSSRSSPARISIASEGRLIPLRDETRVTATLEALAPARTDAAGRAPAAGKLDTCSRPQSRTGGVSRRRSPSRSSRSSPPSSSGSRSPTPRTRRESTHLRRRHHGRGDQRARRPRRRRASREPPSGSVSRAD